MFVVFFAVVIGGRTAGHAGAYAPNYAKARLSANRIFYLLDRKPRIDSYSEEGKKLASFFIIIINLCFIFSSL